MTQSQAITVQARRTPTGQVSWDITVGMDAHGGGLANSYGSAMLDAARYLFDTADATNTPEHRA